MQLNLIEMETARMARLRRMRMLRQRSMAATLRAVSGGLSHPRPPGATNQINFQVADSAR